MRIKLSVPERYPNADLTQFIGIAQRDANTFHLNEQIPSADAWFVIEGTLASDTICKVPPNRVFFLGAETARPLGFYYETAGWLRYLSQFSSIHTPQELYWANAHLDFPFLPWMINANHGADMLNSSTRDIEFLRSFDHPDKRRKLSVFCSTKALTPEHSARLRFVQALKQHFGERLDWFGNGINPVDQKWSGLEPYEHTIVLENQSSSHVLTEKIQDAFLALSKPFYWGAREATALFPKDSFVEIDIRDLPGSIARIENELRRKPSTSQLKTLLEAKSVVTEKLNFMSRIQALAASADLAPPEPHQSVTIRPVSHFVRGPEETKTSKKNGQNRFWATNRTGKSKIPPS